MPNIRQIFSRCLALLMIMGIIGLANYSNPVDSTMPGQENFGVISTPVRLTDVVLNKNGQFAVGQQFPPTAIATVTLPSATERGS